MFYPIYIRIMRKTHLFELDAAEKLDYGMFLTRTAKTTQKCNVWKWFSITLWVRVWLENSIHFLLIYTGMFLVYIFQVSQIFHMRIRYAQLTAQTQHKEYLLVHIGISIYIYCDGWLFVYPWKSGKTLVYYMYMGTLENLYEIEVLCVGYNVLYNRWLKWIIY